MTNTAPEDIIRFKLANGATIIVDPMPTSSALTLSITLLGGSADEAERFAGITHLLEHLLFKQTKNKTSQQISYTIDELGGDVNAFTDPDTLCLLGTVPAADGIELLHFLIELLRDANFTEAHLNLEKEIIRQEILDVEDNPDERAAQQLRSTLWQNTSLGRSVAGSLQTLANISLADVKDRLRELLVGERILIVAAGNCDPEQFHAEVAASLGHLPSSEFALLERPLTPAFGEVRVSAPAAQYTLLLGGPWPDARDEGYLAGSVLVSILGQGTSSRLFEEIREQRGLCYDIGAYIESYRGTAALIIRASCEPERLEELLAALKTEISKLHDSGISEEELRRHVRLLAAQLSLEVDSAGARMWRALDSEITFMRYFSATAVRTLLNSLTTETVNRLCQRYLDPEKMLAVVAGDFETARE